MPSSWQLCAVLSGVWRHHVWAGVIAIGTAPADTFVPAIWDCYCPSFLVAPGKLFQPHREAIIAGIMIVNTGNARVVKIDRVLMGSGLFVLIVAIIAPGWSSSPAST